MGPLSMLATTLNLPRTRRLLDSFGWADLFIEELGWSRPPASSPPLALLVAADTFTLRPIAHLGGAWVYGVSSPTGLIPDQQARLALHRATLSRQREHLLIFEDIGQYQTLWSWPRFEGGKLLARTHLYVKGQPGDLFLSKLSNIYFDLNELDETGAADLVTVTKRLKKALDVSPVTREFYKVFSQQQLQVVAAVQGLPNEPRRQQHYASVLLTRLMFVYFLQKKFLLDNGNDHYLEQKLAAHKAWAATQPGTPPTFYRRFLRELFFQGFALHPEHRDPAVAPLLGTIPYLNGGLFLQHPIEQEYPDLDLQDEAIQQLLGVFTRFSWNLNDQAGGQDNEINPDVLGYIFEKYINTNSSKQKGAGAFYTPTEITTYLCDQTVDGLLLRACNDPEGQPAIKGTPAYHFGTLDELLMHLDDRLAKKLLLDVLPHLSLLDPACGSGAFLVAALKKLETVYIAVVGYVSVRATDTWLRDWLKKAQGHKNLGYFIKKEIITRNLFGVDLMDEAVEIARLRLFLALVATAEKPADLEPLPNIDFNLMEGNGLVGLLHIREEDFNRYAKNELTQFDLFAPEYQDLLRQKTQLIDEYKGLDAGHLPNDTGLGLLRDAIQKKLDAARDTLNQVLVASLQAAKVGFQQARWDAAKGKETYTKTRLTAAHLRELRPFHWGYEFNRVLVERGGFDAIIANPPWETFKPNAKEFFEEYAEVVQKKNMRIEDFEQKKAELLRDPDLRQAWEAYLSRFPHVSELFRTSPDYTAQVAEVNGKRTSSDLNLYKLFLERSFRLLRPGGACGIIVPTGLYTDLGAKGLRQLLFDEARVTHIFGLSNERKLFEDVDHRFKYAIVVFEKGNTTHDFAAAFRIQPREAVGRDGLARLFRDDDQQIRIPVELIRRLSPGSNSVPEFRSAEDQRVAEKLYFFPRIEKVIENSDSWEVSLTNELHMTGDKDLFRSEDGPAHLPLYEGKMFHQFADQFTSTARYWLDETAGRERILGKEKDEGQTLNYQSYRLAFRDIASATNERTMIATILPPNIFCGHTVSSLRVIKKGVRVVSEALQLYLVGVLNSFVFDWSLRLKVTTHCSFFHVYGQPVPRLISSDTRFQKIARLSAQLICTTPAFDALAQAAGLAGHQEAVIDPAARAGLRAELDAQVAHLYSLTEAELAHVLESFPLVKAEAKAATLAAFRAQLPHPDEAALAALIAQGEGRRLEFKRGAFHNPHTGRRDDAMILAVVTAVAAFLNSDLGGTLLLGIADKPVTVIGLTDDLATAGLASEDAYALALSAALAARLGKQFVGHWDVEFATVEGLRLCRVVVRPALAPVWLSGELHTRGPAGKQKLDAQAALEYVKQRFGQA